MSNISLHEYHKIILIAVFDEYEYLSDLNFQTSKAIEKLKEAILAYCESRHNLIYHNSLNKFTIGKALGVTVISDMFDHMYEDLPSFLCEFAFEYNQNAA